MKKKYLISAGIWLTSVLIVAGIIFSLQNSGILPRFFPEKAMANPGDCSITGDFIINNGYNLNVSGKIHGSLECYSVESVSFGCLGSGTRTCSAGYYLAGVEFCNSCPAEGKICGLRCCKATP